jgi:hypothetical protein
MNRFWDKGRTRHPELRGSKHGMARLTEEDVREIRRRTDMPDIALAKAFMVCRKHIYHIKKGLFWRHV